MECVGLGLWGLIVENLDCGEFGLWRIGAVENLNYGGIWSVVDLECENMNYGNFNYGGLELWLGY